MKQCPKYICLPNEGSGYVLYKFDEKIEAYKFLKNTDGTADEMPKSLPAKILFFYGIIHTLWLDVEVNSDDEEVVKGVMSLALEEAQVSSDVLANDELIFKKITKRKANERETSVRYSVCVLDENRPRILPKSSVMACNVSANIKPIPRGGGALWKEFGDYVFAFRGEGGVLFAQVLPGNEFDENAIAEMSLVHLNLTESDLLKEKLSAFKILLSEKEQKNISEQRLKILANKLACEISLEERSSPKCDFIKDKNFDFLKPLELKQIIENKRNKKNIFVASAFGVAVFLLFLALNYFPTLNLKNKIKNLEEQLSTLQEPYESLRIQDEFALSLVNSYKPQTYAVEKLFNLSQLLPERGVRFTLISFHSEKGVTIKGESSSLPLALNFKNELKNSAIGKSYDWDFPQPSIAPNGVAKFFARGK